MRLWPLVAVTALLAALIAPAAQPVMAKGADAITKAFFAQATGGQGGGNGGGTGTGTGAGQAGGTGTGTGQAGGTTTGGNGTAAGSTTGGTGGEPPVVTPPLPDDVEGEKTSNVAKENLRFGEDIFGPSRQAILAARSRAAKAAQEGNAFTEPSGPISLGSINATPPETYQIGPGDRLTLRVSSTFTAPTETQITVDPRGSIVVPLSGRRLVVRGLTMAQAESTLSKEVGSIIRNPSVTLTLDELRTFTVTVLGESFAPGAYQVPATFSVFNLVLATGGPTERGALRNIQLRRNNAPPRTFDLYKFLITGQADQDIQLQPGDVIFFPVSKGQVSVEGEVNRPSTFEIVGGETLKQILGFAGGVRPSGISQNVSIDSVVPGSERRLLNINVGSAAPSANPVINDGDKITVFSIRPIVRNQVEILGSVEQPRAYAFRPGMRVSDLVETALGLRPEADKSIAELRRTNADGSTELVRVRLAEALAKTPAANIELRADDKLTVFDINDVAWRGDRKVVLTGAVRFPGDFYRADNMRVGDLIRQGRGLEPTAFAQEAHLQRFNPDGSPGPLVKFNPLKAAMGDPAHDILLQDRDQVKVYLVSEWQARPAFSVQVKGAVQRPELYPLSMGMKVSDLIELAGGLALNAHQKDAFLQRINLDGTLGPLLLINPSEALKGDPRHNLELKAGDILNLYNANEWRANPDLTVEVSGAVQRPGSFGLAQGMKVKDLVSLAGGPALDAYTKTAFLQRTNKDGTLGALQTIDLEKAIADDPQNNLELQSRDKLSVYTLKDAQFLIERTVTIVGGVQRPGTFPRGEGMTLKNLIDLAGGLLPNSEAVALIAAANAPEGTNVQRVTADQAGSWLIKDRDTVTVPLDASILVEPIQVIINGAVANPGVYFFTRRDQKITDLIAAAGGLRNEAWVQGAQMSRKPEFLKTEAQKNQGPRLQQVLSLIQDEEYKRAIAKAEADRLIFISSSLQGSATNASLPVGAGATAEVGGVTTLPDATVASAQLVTKARKGDDATTTLLGGNMELRLDFALKNATSPHNVALKQGDVLTIPEKPSTILVDGPGVVLPRAFVFEPGRPLRHYLEKAGGFTNDADPGAVLIIRPSGSLFRAKPSTRIELGDVIYVPTRVMTVKLGSNREAFDRTIRSLSNAALVYGFFRSLTR